MVQNIGNDGRKHGSKDILWPMSLVKKGDSLSNLDLNGKLLGWEIIRHFVSVYQTKKRKFLRNILRISRRKLQSNVVVLR